ncbi:hypothetical protein CPB83DRAFT_848557 [Crepidotus variabilis]|uniref:Uncharacterized protein n=1 Tax=Crepidotus variabilis TaxID=179855 RepID=A0A9P6EMT6_9AGAR|nr:hypothetical protein CPB83DRAFT_848557 [Crepidotus variabilis]
MSDNRALHSTAGFYDYPLPPVAASIRDGFQWSSSSGAVVSGLLAAVAAQLLGTFKGDQNLQPQGARDLLVAACYAAIFLNINATVGSFVLIDDLAEVGLEATKRYQAQGDGFTAVKMDNRGPSQILTKFGASKMWRPILIHWMVTFFLGIMSIVLALLIYVRLTEPVATFVVMCFLVAITLPPTVYFMFLRDARLVWLKG